VLGALWQVFTTILLTRRQAARRGEGFDRTDVMPINSIRAGLDRLSRFYVSRHLARHLGAEEIRTLCGAVGYRRDTSLQEWLDGILLGGGNCRHSNRHRGKEVPLERLKYRRDS
jgi:hypothetical protein